VLDAALVTGTGKDLVGAVAAHVLAERFGSYPQTANFPTLLGQAFSATGLCAVKQPNPTPQQQLELALYELACAVNRLRNKQGTGHGRPFLPEVTPARRGLRFRAWASLPLGCLTDNRHSRPTDRCQLSRTNP
jgi:hypothetical protein